MKALYITLWILIPTSIFAQKEMNTDFSRRLKKINFTGAAGELKSKALKAGLSWECCIEEKCECTDLKDPWEEDKSLTYQQQISKIKNDKSASQLQKDMVNLEQSILYGKGVRVIEPQVVKSAFEKFPGYSYEAMKNRMNFYILSLESETEDE